MILLVILIINIINLILIHQNYFQGNIEGAVFWGVTANYILNIVLFAELVLKAGN